MKMRSALVASLTVLAALFAFAASAAADPGALKILHIDTCTPSGDYNYDVFETQLRAEPGVAQVDGRYGHSVAPTAAELSAYDGVAVTAWCEYYDPFPTELGNALADYQDAGGVVVAFEWTYYDPELSDGWYLKGRWMEQLSPVLPNQGYVSGDSTGTVITSTHPIFAGISALGSNDIYDGTLAPGAEALLNWDTGELAVARKGRAVAVNAIPVQDGADGDYEWEYGRLVINAVKYLGRKSVTVTKSGAGTVTSSVGGLACGSVCSVFLPSYSQTQLTATPAKGSVFTGWGGVCSGNAATCAVSIDLTDVAATATFASGTLKFGKLTKRKLSLKLPGAGKLKLTGSGLSTVKKTVKKSGKVTLTLKPKRALKKKIARKGSARVKIKFAFTPTGASSAVSSSKTYKLKR